MQSLWRLWDFFCWKATKSRSLLSSFSFQILVGLTILNEHLSIQTWYRNYLHPTGLSIINVSLLTLCGKGIKQSQFPRETDDSESNFQPCKDKPNSHAWSTVESLPSNHLLLIPGRGSAPLSPTTENRSSLYLWFVLQHKINFQCNLTYYL